MILTDDEIQALAEQGMIEPYEPTLVRECNGQRVISYGQSSMGYDIRLGPEFKLFVPGPSVVVIDPKYPDGRAYQEFVGNGCIIPPNSYVLGRSIERFAIPDDILVVVLGKSTLARAGILVNVTPGEPGWCGYWTIEISNATPLPVRVYAHEGIAQCLFFRASQPARVTYGQRGGKYQNQGPEPVPARL